LLDGSEFIYGELNVEVIFYVRIHFYLLTSA
jgi:hypothetical protein